MSDRVVSILRTAVPTAWGALLGLLLPHLPWLPATVSEWLASTAVVEFVVGLCIVAWYAVWRWAEPKIPAWLVTLVLGSSKAPTYRAKVDEAALNAMYSRMAAEGDPDETSEWVVRDSTGRASGGIVGATSLTVTGSVSCSHGPLSSAWTDPDGTHHLHMAIPAATTATEAAADEAAAGNDRTGFPYADGDDAA